MKREFLVNISFLILINLLIKPLYLFGIDRTVQNSLDAGEYGLFFVLFNFTYLFQIVNDFGLQSYNSRHVAQSRQLISKYLPSAMLLKGLLATVFVLLVLVFGWWAGYLQAHPQLLLLVALNHILGSLILFLRSNLAGLGLYRYDSIFSILDRLLLILILGTLLLTPSLKGQLSIKLFVLIQSVTLIITALSCWWWVRRYSGTLRFRFRWPLILLILKKSAPYALAVFFMTAYTRIDGVMIEQLLPNGQIEADLYAAAYRLLDASNMIGFLFANLLLPMFARMLRKGESVGELVQFSLQFIWAGALPLALGVYFYRTPIMELLYVDGSPYSGKILGYLILSFIAVSGTYIYGTLLTANESLRKMNVIFLAGVVLNVGLNLYLIPRQQAAGAALATCITQFAMFLAQFILSFREVGIRAAPWLAIRLGVFAALVLVINWLSTAFFFDSDWLLRFGSVLLLSILLAFVFRLIHLKGIIELLKQR